MCVLSLPIIVAGDYGYGWQHEMHSYCTVFSSVAELVYFGNIFKKVFFQISLTIITYLQITCRLN